MSKVEVKSDSIKYANMNDMHEMNMTTIDAIVFIYDITNIYKLATIIA